MALWVVIQTFSHGQLYSNVYVVNSRVKYSSELSTALSRNDSRTIILNSNITTDRHEQTMFGSTYIGSGRSLVIEPSTYEDQDADGVIWSLPAFVPLLNIKEGGSLTLSNFTIMAKTDECKGIISKREWFFQGKHISMPVFGGLLPRAFMMTPNNGVELLDGNPAAVSLQSMRFKFERCCKTTIAAMDELLAAAQLAGLGPNMPTKLEVGGMLILNCPSCLYQAMPLGTTSISPADHPSAIVSLVDTTIMCRLEPPTSEQNWKWIMPAVLAVLLLLAVPIVWLTCLRATRRRQVQEAVFSGVSQPQGLVVGVPLPHAMGEHVKDWDVESALVDVAAVEGVQVIQIVDQ